MIKVVKESKDLGPPYEFCVACGKETSYWHAEKDVPLCQKCARTAQEYEIPTKKAWAVIS